MLGEQSTNKPHSQFLTQYLSDQIILRYNSRWKQWARLSKPSSRALGEGKQALVLRSDRKSHCWWRMMKGNYFLCPGVKAVIVHSVFAGFVLLTFANEKGTISGTDLVIKAWVNWAFLLRLCGRADLSEEPGQEMQPWVQIWLTAPQQAPLIFPVSSKSAWCTWALDRGADKWDSPKGWKAICCSRVLHTIQSLHSQSWRCFRETHTHWGLL